MKHPLITNVNNYHGEGSVVPLLNLADVSKDLSTRILKNIHIPIELVMEAPNALICEQTVSAKSKKLKASFSIETYCGLIAQAGEKLAYPILLGILADEISSEILQIVKEHSEAERLVCPYLLADARREDNTIYFAFRYGLLNAAHWND